MAALFFIFLQETVYIYTVGVFVQTPSEWFKFVPLFLIGSCKRKLL